MTTSARCLLRAPAQLQQTDTNNLVVSFLKSQH
uniref:Uncharacterized protein n=1 Tax=Mesocestoides corti TaxID=53468 RepID=A0A5K3FRR0_MESCO